MPFIDTGVYGDGDLYVSDSELLRGYVGEREAHTHYISVRLNYTATVIPGAVEAFRILRIALRMSPGRQGSFSHEGFVDRVEATGHISLRITHSGSEFILSNALIIAQPKKHQPKG